MGRKKAQVQVQKYEGGVSNIVVIHDTIQYTSNRFEECDFVHRFPNDRDIIDRRSKRFRSLKKLFFKFTKEKKNTKTSVATRVCRYRSHSLSPHLFLLVVHKYRVRETLN